MEAIKEIKEVIAAPVLGDEHIVDEEKKIAR
jgi:hypothetical protein